MPEPDDADGARGVGETRGPLRKDIEQQLERILESEYFARSPRLSSFLRFIVEAKLDGDESRVLEYAIGMDVFDRGESFDPRIDSIVRVEAGRLRDRLSRYYAGEGREDPIVIRLPRRGYLPELAHRDRKEASAGKPRAPVLRRMACDPRVAWAAAALMLSALAIQLSLCRAASTREVIELPLPQPSGGTLHTPLGGGGLAVSPDGTRLVYPARDETGLLSFARLMRPAQRPVEQ